MSKNNGTLQIRLADSSDAAELARLNHLFNDCDEPAGNYAARLQDSQRVDTPIVAEIVGRCVGFANLRLVPQFFYPVAYAELTELFVEETHRRLEIGLALLSFAEALAAHAGAEECVIRTDRTNRVARRFYNDCGYAGHDLTLSKLLSKVESQGSKNL